MIQDPHIYAVIIGSEILDKRRVDKHFEYLSSALKEKNLTLFASFTIKDDETLITQTYELIKKDPKAFMFSFGGIGSTPDDLTRKLSANVFEDGTLYRHAQFEKDIQTRLGERAYPYPIRMSDLPKNAQLLFNPINNMSGFYLQDRYFFMPGFPEMAQPMMDYIIKTHLQKPTKVYIQSLLAYCGEGKLMHLMVDVPKDLDLSSLPMMNDGNPHVEFSLSGINEDEVKQQFKKFTYFLNSEDIGYKLIWNSPYFL